MCVETAIDTPIWRQHKGDFRKNKTLVTVASGPSRSSATPDRDAFGAPLGEWDDETGVLRRDPLLRGLDDELEEVGVAQPGHLGHQVELAVPAPAGVRIDLEEPDLAFAIGAEIEAGIVAAAEPLEQDVRVIDDFAARFLVEPRLAVADLCPVGRAGHPFGFVGQNARQLRV